jgi:hypothetical protein
VTRAAKRISTGGRAHPLKRCLRYFGALTVARDQPAPKPRISVWSCRRDQQPRAEYAVAGWSVGARRRVGSAAVLPAPRAPGSGRTAPAKAPRRAARSTSGRTRAFDRKERSPRPQPDASPGHKTQPRGDTTRPPRIDWDRARHGSPQLVLGPDPRRAASNDCCGYGGRQRSAARPPPSGVWSSFGFEAPESSLPASTVASSSPCRWSSGTTNPSMRSRNCMSSVIASSTADWS